MVKNQGGRNSICRLAFSEQEELHNLFPEKFFRNESTIYHISSALQEKDSLN